MALNGRVLLLNQTYEPLGTVSCRASDHHDFQKHRLRRGVGRRSRAAFGT